MHEFSNSLLTLLELIGLFLGRVLIIFKQRHDEAD
jgi:hypothetical protein